MSHINNITRATKAYHILADATNYHLSLTDMIERLALHGGSQHLFASYKALTGESRKSLHPQMLIRNFYRALDITGNSLEEKIDLLNEFGHGVDPTTGQCPDCGRRASICVNTYSKCGISPNNIGVQA